MTISGRLVVVGLVMVKVVVVVEEEEEEEAYLGGLAFATLLFASLYF